MSAGQSMVIGPMGIGRILDAGISLGRRNFRLLALIAAWGLVPAYLFNTIGSSAGLLVREPVGVALVAALSGLGLVAGIVLADIAMVLACARLIEGRTDTDPASVYGDSLGPLWRLVLLGLLVIVAAIPLIILFPLGIYIYVRWAVGYVALIVEGAGPIQCLRRSWELTRSAWWHTFVVVFAGGLIFGILSFLLSSVLTLPAVLLTLLIGESVITVALGSIAGAVSNVVLLPLSTAYLVVLYYELRARNEGYDLAQRALHLDQRPEQVPSPE